MKKKRLTAGQIVEILSEAAAGATIRELWRKHGIAETQFRHWRAK